MNYFYAYLSTDKEKDQILHSIKEIPENRIYIDEEGQQEDEAWKHLITKLKANDILLIPSIDKISSEDKSLKQKLLTVKDLHAQLLTLDEEDLDIDTLLLLIDFVESGRKKRVKKLQKEGINKALEKKYKGEGAFGRPRIHLPDDFGENIKKIMRKEMSHDAYRAQLGFKRSTYYKLVKEEKESWTKGK
ncbi:hypothetical protein [[Eubacterium] hominis]|uniref:hypothetical protein n=1 Tax=[Eubacterium] hominis TaxID=2764325 RepID=UPI003A4DD6CC